MSTATKIHGLTVRPIEKISDARGEILHFMRRDSPEFEAFGEVYFSLTRHQVVKAWKKHLEMTQHYICPHGEIKLVVYDDRKESPTCGSIEVIHFGLDDYKLITIPNDLWYGFQALSEPHGIIANFTNIPHAPEECISLPADDPSIPYRWI